ncbi:MAG: hypothetical protein WBB29_03820 [Geitlerinemataceae cyanobacterium]
MVKTSKLKAQPKKLTAEEYLIASRGFVSLREIGIHHCDFKRQKMIDVR